MVLLTILRANYARIEASYYQINLADTSARKVLNLAFDWLIEMHQGRKEDWERDFQHIFDDREHEDFDYVDANTPL